ncbi:hypothetical protein U1Q18_041921, partial [Sarracenia purpurea var. burkii]
MTVGCAKVCCCVGAHGGCSTVQCYMQMLTMHCSCLCDCPSMSANLAADMAANGAHFVLLMGFNREMASKLHKLLA